MVSAVVGLWTADSVLRGAIATGSLSAWLARSCDQSSQSEPTDPSCARVKCCCFKARVGLKVLECCDDTYVYS